MKKIIFIYIATLLIMTLTIAIIFFGLTIYYQPSTLTNNVVKGCTMDEFGGYCNDYLDKMMTAVSINILNPNITEENLIVLIVKEIKDFNGNSFILGQNKKDSHVFYLVESTETNEGREPQKFIITNNETGVLSFTLQSVFPLPRKRIFYEINYRIIDLLPDGK